VRECSAQPTEFEGATVVDGRGSRCAAGITRNMAIKPRIANFLESNITFRYPPKLLSSLSMLLFALAVLANLGFMIGQNHTRLTTTKC
jgi:hypothetical protein